MKLFFTFCLFAFCLGSNFGQTTFSDDFEAYSDGAYIAASNPKWSTWSKKPGTEEDAKVTKEKAKSGALSLKIINTVPAGGATDLILPFGARYATGQFNYKMSMFIPKDNNAYFNFQGSATVGQTWALDANFFANGVMVLSNSSVAKLTAAYPVNEWFELEFDINLSYNLWKVKVNGNCIGAFANGTNSIASIDLFPINAATLYYVDDVSFSHTTQVTKVGLDGGLSEFNWNNGKLSGTTDKPILTFRNFGDTTVNSIDLNIEIDGGSMPVAVNNLSLKKGQTLKLTLPEITLKDGLNVVRANIVKLNGQSTDEEICNNSASFLVNATAPAENRAVLVEEGTGTWCQWCPRGAVFMDLYAKYYPKTFIPIAVHNGVNDPMKVAEYDSFMDFPGFPNCKINRNDLLDPSASEVPFLREITKSPVAKILPGAKYNATTKTFDVSAVVEFLSDMSGDFYATLVLTEDDVKGTTAGYNQSNAYAGGSNGVMGGFELLANPVPAAQMVYDHVARAVSGLTSSATNSFTGTYKSGDKVTLNFTFTLGSTWKTDNMHIIPILLGDSGYLNAATATFTEAIATGFTTGTHNTVLSENSVSIYPNPAENETNLEISLPNPSEVSVTLYHISGQTLAKRDYGILNGDQILPIPLYKLNSGVYLVEIKTNQGSRFEKIVVR